ncbi:BgTH12-02248 [Blumeria graminis f. sp. triticale]|nr:BgTH12-02248 [Blumeria graminis f. sp. triticale]
MAFSDMPTQIKAKLSRLPTLEVFARFAPGTIDPIVALRNKYAPKQIYPRDVGIRLISHVYKNEFSLRILTSNLMSLATTTIVPFDAPIIKAFRNSTVKKKALPPSVYYQISGVPNFYIASHLSELFHDLHTQLNREPIATSYKLGITGLLESHRESGRIVRELSALEHPPPIRFDAFVLVTRSNLIAPFELESNDIVFPFSGNQMVYDSYLEDLKKRYRKPYEIL